ncbi:hypothetical protein HED49_03335 [Ochrobactrum daejeonense]|nr:hypothetical protein [Brucella daejeonensis]
MTVRTIDEIFRDFVTDGVPASGPFNPHKPDIRDTLKALTEGARISPTTASFALTMPTKARLTISLLRLLSRSRRRHIRCSIS